VLIKFDNVAIVDPRLLRQAENLSRRSSYYRCSLSRLIEKLAINFSDLGENQPKLLLTTCQT
jgi:hypothetical protein